MRVPRTPSLSSVAALTAVLALAAAARAEEPEVGEVRRLQVITLSLRVGSTEKETKQVVYVPPPGWYVRAHRVDCPVKQGNSSFTVSTTPRDWNWSSESSVKESYKLLIDVAAKGAQPELEAKLAAERDQALAELRKVRASHHALVVDATARGEGLLRGGGALELSVTAEIVYLGTEDAIRRAARRKAGLAQH